MGPDQARSAVPLATWRSLAIRLHVVNNSTDLERHLQTTDAEVMAALHAASRDANASGHDPAQRILTRGHFRLLYERNPEDVKLTPESGQAVFEAAQREFGEQQVRRDRETPRAGAPDFPVQTKDGRIASSMAISQTLNRVPVASFDYVLVNPDLQHRARKWLEADRPAIIHRPGGD